jgi:hypothetical protein
VVALSIITTVWTASVTSRVAMTVPIPIVTPMPMTMPLVIGVIIHHLMHVKRSEIDQLGSVKLSAHAWNNLRSLIDPFGVVAS